MPVLIQGSRLCLGLDPSPELLGQWRLPDSRKGLRAFGEICLSALDSTPCIVKPQVAFYERMGSQGYAELEHLLQQLHEMGIPYIVDAKRGDIGSTMAAYADAWFNRRDYSPTAITASPYLGFEPLAPLLIRAAEAGAVVYLVVRSSNPEGNALQQAQLPDGTRIAEMLCDQIATYNQQTGRQTAGAVLGATQLQDFSPLAERLQGAPILAPGIGAQGASLQELAKTAGSAFAQITAPLSRALLQEGPDPAKLAAAIREYQCQDRELRKQMTRYMPTS